MKLSKIQLTNFKNYDSLSCSFSGEITCFSGNNGEGKTNLLDAIFYLCIGKSYFQSVEKLNRKHDTSFLRLEGLFQKNSKSEVVSVVSQQGKMKRIERNQVLLDRVSSHLGFAPVCFISPNDSDLLLGGSETRRRFIDTTLSQMNKNYLLQLIEYRKVLQQRNALLKQDVVDSSLLSTYDEQIIPLGESIYKVRQAYVGELSARAKLNYQQISDHKEELSCVYHSQLNETDYISGLKEARQKDLMLRRSTFGVHRDDLQLFIDEYELKKVGSQGQQKTALLSLKLAELDLLANYTKSSPILLLDDIFDKLDIHRIQQLFAYITTEFSSQIFLTDTNPDRLHQLLRNFDRKFEIYIVEKNQLNLYEN